MIKWILPIILLFPLLLSGQELILNGNTTVKKVPKVQILYLSQDGCVPCLLFDRQQAPDLKIKGWGLTFKETDYIRKVNLSEHPEFMKYNIKNGYPRGVPLFIKLVDGVEVDAISGYTTGRTLTRLFYGTDSR